MNTHLFDNSSCVDDEKYEDFFFKKMAGAGENKCSFF